MFDFLLEGWPQLTQIQLGNLMVTFSSFSHTFAFEVL
jgi:hypothetical protein